MRQPYPWLQAYLKAHINELKGLRNTPHDIKKAVGWFNSLLKYFRQRNLSTPRQQKNYVVDVRNDIKSRFGEDHPALQVVGFDAETWTQINQPIHDRVEDRLQNTRFLTNPDAIVERAETLLSSKTSTWADLAVGLGVVIGRRLSELLGLKTKLEPKTEFSILFRASSNIKASLPPLKYLHFVPPAQCWVRGNGLNSCSDRNNSIHNQSTGASAASARKPLTATLPI